MTLDSSMTIESSDGTKTVPPVLPYLGLSKAEYAAKFQKSIDRRRANGLRVVTKFSSCQKIQWCPGGWKPIAKGKQQPANARQKELDHFGKKYRTLHEEVYFVNTFL